MSVLICNTLIVYSLRVFKSEELVSPFFLVHLTAADHSTPQISLAIQMKEIFGEIDKHTHIQCYLVASNDNHYDVNAQLK